MALRKATKEELKFISSCRNAVKSANFALLYGSGVSTLAEALMKSDPNLTESMAKKLAKQLIEYKKGKKIYTEDGCPVYVGGIDSAVYNAFYKGTHSHVTKLPGLGTRISTALEYNAVGDDYKTSRENFLIQASGVEFLSAILVLITYFSDKIGLDAHYCLSIHDEIAFIVAEEDVELFAGVLQIAHFYTWSLFYEQFGIDEFPYQKAFFDSIEVGHCLRKEAHENLKTPSNPDGDKEPPGIVYTAEDLYKKGVFNALRNLFE
jgi:DNA polymerase gamma 1